MTKKDYSEKKTKAVASAEFSLSSIKNVLETFNESECKELCREKCAVEKTEKLLDSCNMMLEVITKAKRYMQILESAKRSVDSFIAASNNKQTLGTKAMEALVIVSRSEIPRLTFSQICKINQTSNPSSFLHSVSKAMVIRVPCLERGESIGKTASLFSLRVRGVFGKVISSRHGLEEFEAAGSLAVRLQSEVMVRSGKDKKLDTSIAVVKELNEEFKHCIEELDVGIAGVEKTVRKLYGTLLQYRMSVLDAISYS